MDLTGWIWSFWKEKGTWPTRRDCFVQVHKEGFQPDQIVGPATLTGSEPFGGLRDDELVHPTPNELMGVEDFRRLLKPAPDVLGLAAARVISDPPFNDPDFTKARITRAELLPSWSTEADARWGFQALTILPFQIAAMSLGGGDFGFEPTLEHLRYEQVRTFNEALRIAHEVHPRTLLETKVSALPQPHRDLLVAVVGHLEKTGAWPNPVRLTVERRGLGFVPDLVGDLNPDFIRETFDRLRMSRISATFRVLDELPEAERIRQTLVQMVRQLAQRFPNDPSAVRLELLAHDVDQPTESLLPAVAFSFGEPWWGGTSPTPKATDWTIRANSKVLSCAKILNWADYMAVRGKLVPPAPNRYVVNLAETVPLAGSESPNRPKSYDRRWRIVEDIDQGGQAHVFKVVDRSDSSGTVFALKRMKNPKRKGRFDQEIGALKLLTHPAIPKIVDHSVPSDEDQWLVMPFAEDGNLKDKVALFKGNIDSTLQVSLNLADALGHAHDNSVIHRDVKPENILFPKKNDPTCWLSDFGICLFVDGPRYTEPDEIVGPRFFMAPEVEQGGPESATAAADVYSLGKVIYYILSGGTVPYREAHREPPWNSVFEGHDPRLELMGELLDGMIALLPSRTKTMSEVREQVSRIINWDGHSVIRPRPSMRSKAPAPGLDWTLAADAFQAQVLSALGAADTLAIDIFAEEMRTQIRKLAKEDADVGSELAERFDRLALLSSVLLRFKPQQIVRVMPIWSAASIATTAPTGVGLEVRQRLARAQRLLSQRIYSLGALAVQSKKWAELRELVLIRPNPGSHLWLREMNAAGGRQKLPPDSFLPETVELVRRIPQLLPEVSESDELLSLLAQFDVLALLLSLVEDPEEEFPHWPIFLWGAPHQGMTVVEDLLSDGEIARQLLGEDHGDMRALLQRFRRTVNRVANESQRPWFGFEDSRKIRQFLGISP